LPVRQTMLHLYSGLIFYIKSSQTKNTLLLNHKLRTLYPGTTLIQLSYA